MLLILQTMSTDQDLCLHGVPKSRKHQSSQYQKITAQITKMHHMPFSLYYAQSFCCCFLIVVATNVLFQMNTRPVTLR